jgi:polysaccharide deacetylase 2 family uncharacterized protein YibQ
LVDSAVDQGVAIGIAHPSAETLAALPKVAAAFEVKGVRLVPVSELLDLRLLSAVKEARVGSDP